MIIQQPMASHPSGQRSRILLFVVPALCFAVAVWLRPAGRLGPPERAEWIDQLLYDDRDFAAYALRGMNHFLGRHAGRVEAPERQYEDYADSLHETRPLLDSYYLEYPHAALMLFHLPYLFSTVSENAPASLLDGAHEDLVFHTPGIEEAGLWEHFHRIVTSYMFMMLAFHAALVIALAAGYLPGGGLAYRGFLLLLPGALFFSLNRFDIVPVLFTALSFACMGRGRVVPSAMLLAAGALVKVYPIFLAPLFARYLMSAKNTRTAALWCFAFTSTLIAFLCPAMLAWGVNEVLAPYLVQLSRKHEGFTTYLYLIPHEDLRDTLAGNGPIGRIFRPGTLALVLGLMLWRPISDLPDLLRRGAVVVIAFISLSVFYSPQWVLWLTPLLLPLAGRDRRLLMLLVALDLLTWLQWPVA